MAASKVMKFGPHLKELRIHLCQKSVESQGVRDFLQNSYVGLKKNNPRFPILVRECSGVQPVLWARYEFGKESSVSLAGMKSDQVNSAIEMIASEGK